MAITLCVASACSSQVIAGSANPQTGGGPGGSGQGAQTGSSITGGFGGAGGGSQWTNCTSPDGFAICGGPAHCGVGGICLGCSDEKMAEKGEVTACFTQAWANQQNYISCYLCDDGNLCPRYSYKGGYNCGPFSMGVLFAKAGAADRVRYADFGLWTGKPIPEPDSCPKLGIALCGGKCGGCPTGKICTGRSPLHPYSVCIPDYVKPCIGWCNSGYSCFSYLVEPESQAVADENGYCLEINECQALAAKLPGGPNAEWMGNSARRISRGLRRHRCRRSRVRIGGRHDHPEQREWIRFGIRRQRASSRLRVRRRDPSLRRQERVQIAHAA